MLYHGPAEVERTASGGPAHLVRASPVSSSSMRLHFRRGIILLSSLSRTQGHARTSTTGCALLSHVSWESERESLVPEHERVVALACGDWRARSSVGVLCSATLLWTVARAISLLFSCVRARRCIRTVRQVCRNYRVIAAADRAISSAHLDFEPRIRASLPGTLLPSAQLIVPDAADASCCSAPTSPAFRRRRSSKWRFRSSI